MTKLVYVAYDKKNVSNFEIFSKYEQALQFKNNYPTPSTWEIISKKINSEVAK